MFYVLQNIIVICSHTIVNLVIVLASNHTTALGLQQEMTLLVSYNFSNSREA